MQATFFIYAWFFTDKGIEKGIENQIQIQAQSNNPA